MHSTHVTGCMPWHPGKQDSPSLRNSLLLHPFLLLGPERQEQLLDFLLCVDSAAHIRSTHQVQRECAWKQGTQ